MTKQQFCSLSEFESLLEKHCATWSTEAAGYLVKVLRRNHASSRLERYCRNHRICPDRYMAHVHDVWNSDNELFKRIRIVRNEDAWTELYDTLFRAACAFLRKNGVQTGVEDLAYDYVNSAYEPVMQASYTWDTPFSAWACVVVHNTARKGNTRVGIADRHSDTFDDSDYPPTMLAEVSLEERVALHHDINLALKRLPAHYRQFVEMYYFKGFSLSEIAETLGRSVQAIFSIHKRTKQKLGFILKETWAD